MDRTVEMTKVLGALEACYTNLLGTLRIRKERVRRGDLQGLHDSLEGERDCLERISELDQQREAIMQAVSEASGPAGRAVLDVLSRSGSEAARSEFEKARAQLRTTVGQVEAEYAVLKQVGEALFAHVTCLVQRIHSLTSGGVRYGRTGRIGDGRPLISGVDLRT